jgi:hypothetical protein
VSQQNGVMTGNRDVEGNDVEGGEDRVDGGRWPVANRRKS